MPTNEPTLPAPSPRARLLRFAGIAAFAVAAAWPTSLLFVSSEPATPSLRWTRGLPGAARAFPAAGELPANEPLALEIDLPSAMHVYVISWSFVDGTIALFPSSALRAARVANPLPAGTHVLPGEQGGTRLHWHASDAALTNFVVLASPEPLEDLERALGRCRQMGNAAFPGRQVLGRYAPEAGMEVVPATHEPAHELLRSCTAWPTEGHDGAMRPLPGHDAAFYATLLVRVPTPVRTDVDPRAELRRTAEEIEELSRRYGPDPAPAPAGGGR